MNKVLEVLRVSTYLGLTSFGGPIAHLGYFHREYVERKKWIDEGRYADLVALCQFLPGPASSQIGIGIGKIRAGTLGAIAAWIGFTLPSALALALFALFLKDFDGGALGWIQGLKVVAVAIVAHSILSMGRKLANERSTASIAAVTIGITLFIPTAFTQVILILLSGLLGVYLFRDKTAGTVLTQPKEQKGSKAFLFLVLFFGLLAGLPLLVRTFPEIYLILVDSFYRSGSLVFGGGHVVLPLLELVLVPEGLISKESFLAGYGAAQAVPGPLFTFASYLGAQIAGIPGAVIALIAIFLPSFLLVLGVMPYWDRLRRNPTIQSALIGVNACVVGILAAALYDPLWTTAIHGAADFVLAMALFVLLVFWKTPSWAIVLLGAGAGWAFSIFSL